MKKKAMYLGMGLLFVALSFGAKDRELVIKPRSSKASVMSITNHIHEGINTYQRVNEESLIDSQSDYWNSLVE